MNYRLVSAVLVGVLIGLGCYWLLDKPRPVVTYENLNGRLQEKPLRHLGIIMDGNRRWAKEQGFMPWHGHQKGVKPVKEVISFCLENHIETLTLYVFSLENFNRPAEELSYLFDTLAQEIASNELSQLFEKGIKVRFIGDREQFPHQLVPLIRDIEQKTANNKALMLNLLFCYGGQQEIVAAAQSYARQATSEEAPLTFEKIQSHLWSAGVPPLDLIIRSAGEQRLSNFLPIQSAYSELYFTKYYWPEFTKELLIEAVLFFINSKRNFGA